MENFRLQPQNHASYLDVERSFDSLWEVGSVFHDRRGQRVIDYDQDNRVSPPIPESAVIIPSVDECHNQLQEAATQHSNESISSSQLPAMADHVIMDDGGRLGTTSAGQRSSSSSRIITSKFNRSKSSLVQDMFLILDTDRDGKLSVDEIYDLLRKLGLLASSSSTHDIDHGDNQLDSLRSLIRGAIGSQYTDHLAGLQHESPQHGFGGLDASGFRALYRYIMEGGHHDDPMKLPADAGDQTRLMARRRELLADDANEKMRNDNVDTASDEYVEAAFRVYDRNGDGFISASELALVLRQLGLPEGDDAAACQACIDRHDSDGNGLIDLWEFKSMMLPFLNIPISCH